jgi:small-conductance mechanosensitive channel/CRP-like cAMP-binding protein
VARFVSMSLFFAVETILIVALIGSPLAPVVRPHDLPRQFWLQILACCWWALAAREVIAFLGLLTKLRKTAAGNKLLFDVIAASIYVCSGLAMIGFVFGWPLQGLLATSGIIAIVLGLALQSTLSDLFSGISLSIERPYQLGDEVLLDGAIEGEVVQINWRSTHLRNGSNDVVIVPNSAIAKMRIQNHSAGSRRYSGSLNVTIDSRNEFDFSVKLLTQAAMACPAILEHPPCSVAATEITGDRVTYQLSFSTGSFAAAGDARSQLIAQIYKRARPVSGQQPRLQSLNGLQNFTASPILFFQTTEVLDHLKFFDPLSEAEKAGLNAKMVRHHFEAGDQLLNQGDKNDTFHFVFIGVIQVTHQVPDGRVLNLEKLGPGDTYGELSILTGHPSPGTFRAVTSGLLLGLKAEHLKPILEGRPDLLESLSLYVSQMQEFMTRFERSATQEPAIEPHDLLWRIRNFFRLGLENDMGNGRHVGVGHGDASSHRGPQIGGPRSLASPE